jgi:hypothetical protein
MRVPPRLEGPVVRVSRRLEGPAMRVSRPLWTAGPPESGDGLRSPTGGPGTGPAVFSAGSGGFGKGTGRP